MPRTVCIACLILHCALCIVHCALSSVRRGLDNRAGPADHRVQVGAGGHHRVHRVLLLDLEVDQDRALVAAGVGDGRQHLGALGDRLERMPKASASFAKFGFTRGVAA